MAPVEGCGEWELPLRFHGGGRYKSRKAGKVGAWTCGVVDWTVVWRSGGERVLLRFCRATGCGPFVVARAGRAFFPNLSLRRLGNDGVYQGRGRRRPS